MTPNEAEAELIEWAANNARRDDLVRTANNAGVSKNRIHTLTGIARTTIDRILKEQTMTVADIAREFNVTEADVLALADQLTTLDGSENVVASEENGTVTLTDDAAAVIRDQLSS